MDREIINIIRNLSQQKGIDKISDDEILEMIESTEKDLGYELSGYAVNDKPYKRFFEKSNYPRARISKLVLDKCEELNDKIVFECLDKKISYAELKDKIIMCADALSKKGVRKNDIIVLQVPSLIETIIFYFAVNLIGGITRFADPISSPSYVKDMIIETNAKLFVTSSLGICSIPKIVNNTSVLQTVIIPVRVDNCERFIQKIMFKSFGVVSKLLIAVSSNYVDFNDLILMGNKNAPVSKFLDDFTQNEVASIFSTSGSTGKPKGVSITNENMISSVYKQLNAHYDIDLDDTLFNPMPSNSSYFWDDIVLSILYGIKTTLSPFFNAEKSAEQIIRSKCSIILGGPIIIESLKEYVKTHDVSLKQIKYFISGGALLPLDLELDGNKLFREHESLAIVANAHGMSELCGPSMVPNGVSKVDGTYIEGAAGVPLPGNTVGIFKYDSQNEVRCIDDKDYNEGLMYFDIGEICFKAEDDNVFKEYYKDQQATREAKIMHTDGTIWYHTGDLGFITPAGHLFCVGRKNGLIVRDGHKIWAAKIENVIKSIKGIKDCAIICVPDNKDREAPACFIVYDDEINEEQKNKLIITISSTIKTKLDEMHLPVFFKELEIIPRNVMLKVKLKELMDIYEETMIESQEKSISLSKPKVLKKENNN